MTKKPEDIARRDRACVDSGIAANLADRAADRIEELESMGSIKDEVRDRIEDEHTAARRRVARLSLHPDTAKLVDDFADALAEKLHATEVKYGYTNGWLTDNWENECRGQLQDHISKGDPLDVAAYAAFMWRRGWSTNGWTRTLRRPQRR